MNTAHIIGLSEEELTKGLLPLLNHQHWAYVEEWLRREQHKQVKRLANHDNLIAIGRAQGEFTAYQKLQSLRLNITNSRK